MSWVLISFGSNLGDRVKIITDALSAISKLGSILRVSSLYETRALTLKNTEIQPDFLNGVFELETSMDPHNLLRNILEVEKSLGRHRTPGGKWSARPIDLDILFYDNLILNTDQLTLPHPEIQNRDFVLEPCAELVPDFIHPIIGKSIKSIFEELDGDSFVIRKCQSKIELSSKHDEVFYVQPA